MSSYNLRETWTSKNKWLKNLKNNNLKPIIEVLDETDESDISRLEKYWIEQFKAWGFKLKNETKGGDGFNWLGRKHRKDSIEKMKMNHPLRRIICQYEIGTDELVNEYLSSYDAERETGYHRGHITRCCKGIENFNSVGGYYWRYKDNYFPYKRPNNTPIEIIKYDKNHNLIKMYRSSYELKKELNIDIRNIEKNNFYLEYYWKVFR